MNTQELERRFGLAKVDVPKHEKIVEVSELFMSAAYNLNLLMTDSREKSIAMTHLEEARLIAIAGVARGNA